MKRILVAYATMAGSTLDVAQAVAEEIARSDVQVDLLPLSEVKIDIVPSNYHAEVTCTARTVAQTGVEMEALTGVAVALLTIYDMCKGVDKKMEISNVHLIQKTKRAVSKVYGRRNERKQNP